MKECIITFRSVTPAQRAEAVLKRALMDCVLQRTPRWLEEQGCGYCLKLASSRTPEAVSLLRSSQIPFRKVYLFRAGGKLEEMQL